MCISVIHYSFQLLYNSQCSLSISALCTIVKAALSPLSLAGKIPLPAALRSLHSHSIASSHPLLKGLTFTTLGKLEEKPSEFFQQVSFWSFSLVLTTSWHVLSDIVHKDTVAFLSSHGTKQLLFCLWLAFYKKCFSKIVTQIMVTVQFKNVTGSVWIGVREFSWRFHSNHWLKRNWFWDHCMSVF